MSGTRTIRVTSRKMNIIFLIKNLSMSWVIFYLKVGWYLPYMFPSNYEQVQAIVIAIVRICPRQ